MEKVKIPYTRAELVDGVSVINYKLTPQIKNKFERLCKKGIMAKLREYPFYNGTYYLIK